jgi:hypothetical protein
MLVSLDPSKTWIKVKKSQSTGGHSRCGWNVLAHPAFVSVNVLYAVTSLQTRR